MNRKNRRSPLFGMVTAAALSLLLVGPALADNLETSVTVNGTPLAWGTAPSVPLSGAFGAVTLDGTAQDTTLALNAYQVNDLSGTGDGWNITVSAENLTGLSGAAATAGGVGTPDVLADGLLRLSATAATKVAETTSPIPALLTGNPYSIDSGSFKVHSAALDEGMGKYAFDASLFTLTVPSDAYTGAYDSTVTITLATAP